MPNTRRFRVAIDPFRSSGIAPEVLYQLADMAPNLDDWKTKLARSAYLKGFDAGADFDPADPMLPACPYAARHSLPNYMRGANDPRAAWLAGLLDGSRFRKMMTAPGFLSPVLKWREYQLLPAALQSLANVAGSTVGAT